MGVTKDKMVRSHHRFHGHGIEKTPRDSEGQGAGCAAVPGVTKSQT